MSDKNGKRNRIADGAIELFLEKSVPSVTIRDVAERAGVGEATVYRYFSGRTGLIVACALKLQKDVEKRFVDTKDRGTGYRRLERFYSAYLSTFEERPELYRFLSEFDAYCISERVEILDEYADNLDRFREAFSAAYRDGIADKSVRPVENIELFYYATTHAVLLLCKKLASKESVLRQDKRTDKAAEIRTLIHLILAQLNGEPA
jgi:AcrR family transcriptional regulator